MKGGGIDWIAVTTARMKGWKTQTFLDKTCNHHRPMGTGNSSPLGALFKLGRQDYYLGGHPLWQVFRSTFQMARKPYILGGLLLAAGYAWGLATRAHRPVSRELIRFHQAEQMRRLRQKCLAPFQFSGARSRGVEGELMARGQSSIHNSKMLGAGKLAGGAKHAGNRECAKVGRSAPQYSCSR